MASRDSESNAAFGGDQEYRPQGGVLVGSELVTQGTTKEEKASYEAVWQALEDKRNNKDTTLYYKSGGGYTLKPTEVDQITDITVDKTGIHISAPEKVLQSESYKDAFDSSQFKSIATSYASDPTATVTDANGDEHTLEELMESYRSHLQQLADARPYMDELGSNLTESFGSSGFSDAQLTTAMSWANSKSSSNAAIPIPQWATTLFDFTQYDSFDPEALTLSKSDWDKFYQIKAFDDAHVEKMQEAARTVLGNMAGYANNQNGEYDDLLASEEHKDELARTVSFYNSLFGTEDDPNKPEADVLASIGLGVASFAGTFTNALFTTVDGIGKFLDWVGGDWSDNNDYAWEVLTSPLEVIGHSLQGLSTVGQFFKTLTYSGGNAGVAMATALNDLKEEYGLSDEQVQSIAGNVIQDWHDPSGEYLQILSSDINAAEWWDNFNVEHNALSGAWGAGMVIGNIAYKIFENVILLNPVGGGAGSWLKNLLGGNTVENVTSLLSMSAKSMTAGEIAQVATYTTKLAASLRATNAVASGFGFAANVLAQGIIETIADEPEAMAKLYSREGTASVATALVQNTFYNGVGELTGWGSSKIGDAFAKTAAGQEVMLRIGKFTNKLGELRTATKIKINELAAKIALDDSLAAGKRTLLDKVLELEKEAASAKTYAEFKVATDARIDIENNYDLIVRGARAGVNELKITPGLADKIIAQEAAMAKVSQAFEDAGFKIPTGSTQPQEVANYISYRAHEDYLLNKQAVKKLSGGDLDAADLEKLSVIQGKLAGYKKQFAAAGSDLVDAAEANYTALQEAMYALRKWELKLGLVDAEKIGDLNATGFFGEDGKMYMPTQRFKATGGSDYQTALSKYEQSVNSYSIRARDYLGKVNDSYAKIDVNDDFLDPNIVFEGEKWKAVQTKIAKDWGQSLMNSSGVAEVIGSEKAVNASKKVAEDFNKFKLGVQKRFSGTAAKDFETQLQNVFKKSKLYQTNLLQDKKALTGKIKEAKASVKAAKAEFNQVANSAAAMSITASDIQQLAKSIELPSFSPNAFKTAAEFDKFFSSLDASTKQLVTKTVSSFDGGSGVVSLKAYTSAYDGVEGFDTAVTRSYINNSSKITKTAQYKEMLANIRTAEFDATYIGTLSKNESELQSLIEQINKMPGARLQDTVSAEDVLKAVQGFTSDLTDDIIKSIGKSPEAKEFLKALEGEGLDSTLATQYAALYTIRGNKKALHKMVKDYVLGAKHELTAEHNVVLQSYSKQLNKAIDDCIESQYNIFTRGLIDNGHSSLVDMKETMSRIKQYAADLGDKISRASDNHIISVLDDTGQIVYVQTDPLTADLYTYRPNNAEVNSSVTVKFFNMTNRLFRMGTTGFNPASWARQWAKDPINAFVMGGARPLLDTKMSGLFGKNVYSVLNDATIAKYGDTIVARLKAELGDDGWKAFEDAAAAQGKNVTRLAVEYELQLKPMVQISDAGTQSKAYQQITQARHDSFLAQSGLEIKTDTGARQFVNWLDEQLTKLEDVVPNEARETYLRNAVYQSNYLKALDNGKSIEEARAVATRFMNDATTNFSRPFAWGNRITRSVPYLGAALNGKDSFWRLLEIDPAGVAGRFFGGLVLPYMSLLTESLADPRNREIYKNIKEYEKEGAFVFVAGGQVVELPMPEELAGYMSIFRQVVEKAADANDKSWTDLIVNDMLQIPAFDVSGFYDLDTNSVTSDPTFGERMGRGFEKLFAQMSPVAVKTAYMAMTGRDPYTGKEIDTSYVYLDDQQNVQIMDSTQSTLAKNISDWASRVGISLSPSAARKILTTWFGNGFYGLADGISALFSSTDDDNVVLNVASSLGEVVAGVASPFTTEVYNVGQSDWKRAVSALYDEKEALLNSDEYKKLAQAVSSTYNTDAQHAAALSSYKSYIQSYQQKVVDTATKMKEKYGITAAQQASVLSLLTMFDNGVAAITPDAQSYNQELYYAARSQANQTMAKLGFTGANDLSILGYGKYNSNGDYVYQFNAAPDILDMGNVVWGQDEITAASISRAIKNNGLDTEYKNTFKTQLNELYSKKDYDGVEKLQKEWNAKVMQAVLPYLEKYGLRNVLANESIIDELEPYISVPSDAMGTAKYIKSSSGIDKNEAYIKSYLQAFYKNLQEQ